MGPHRLYAGWDGDRKLRSDVVGVTVT